MAEDNGRATIREVRDLVDALRKENAEQHAEVMKAINGNTSKIAGLDVQVKNNKEDILALEQKSNRNDWVTSFIAIAGSIIAALTKPS